MIIKTIRLTLTLLLAIIAGACGLKGDLYLDETPPGSETPAAGLDDGTAEQPIAVQPEQRKAAPRPAE